MLLHRLKHDPSLRFSEAGRALIRLLSLHMLGRSELQHLLDVIPEHLRPVVADLARACAGTWGELAEQLAPERPAETTRELGHLRRRRNDELRRDGA